MNAPKQLTTIAVPLKWRTQFKRTPSDFALYLVIADWLEERCERHLHWRAAAARQWLPWASRQFAPAALAPRPEQWHWYALQRSLRPPRHLGLLPYSVLPVLRSSVLPVAVFTTLLRPARSAWRAHGRVKEAGYNTVADAHAALLAALRAVPPAQLAEWSRVRS